MCATLAASSESWISTFTQAKLAFAERDQLDLIDPGDRELSNQLDLNHEGCEDYWETQ